MSGVSHSSLSNSTDESIALIAVPWVNRETRNVSGHQLFFLLNIYLLLSDCTLGIKYPPSVVSLLAILGNPAGTMFPILWDS